MHWVFLAAGMMAAAILLWRVRSGGRSGGAAGALAAPEETDAFRLWLEESVDSGKLEQAVEALWEMMAHPALGGPGFLSIRLTAGKSGLTVTAQYPNIKETLHRSLACGAAGEEALRAAGVPEALLALGPGFSAESGGVVEIVLEAAASPCPPADRRTRQAALERLEKRLAERFPELSVRRIGSELLLEKAGDDAFACSS